VACRYIKDVHTCKEIEQASYGKDAPVKFEKQSPFLFLFLFAEYIFDSFILTVSKLFLGSADLFRKIHGAQTKEEEESDSRVAVTEV